MERYDRYENLQRLLDTAIATGAPEAQVTALREEIKTCWEYVEWKSKDQQRSDHVSYWMTASHKAEKALEAWKTGTFWGLVACLLLGFGVGCAVFY